MFASVLVSGLDVECTKPRKHVFAVIAFKKSLHDIQIGIVRVTSWPCLIAHRATVRHCQSPIADHHAVLERVGWCHPDLEK